MSIQKIIVLSFGLSLLSGYSIAVEVQPRGQIQAQTEYNNPEIGAGANWNLSMAQSYIGVSAVEALETSTIMAHWQAGVDPLADDPAVVLLPQEAYLSWSQSAFKLTLGRLNTLDKEYLLGLSNNLISEANNGLAIGNYIQLYENKALRLSFTSGEYLAFASQWQIDADQVGTPVSVASVINTPEGSVSLTYRKDELDVSTWGSQVSWKAGNTAVSYATIYREEQLAWDMSVRSYGQTVQSFAGLSSDKLTDTVIWFGGIAQHLSQNLVNYSEVQWQENDGRIKWTTGFRLTF